MNRRERATTVRGPSVASPLGWLALGLGLAAMLLGASSARAERACELPAEISGRTCSVATCIALQDNVNALCKPKPAQCKPGEGCFNLRTKRQKFLNCYVARSTINVTCWNGGDATHQGEAAYSIEQVGNCDAIIALPEPLGCADPCPFNFSDATSSNEAARDDGESPSDATETESGP